MPSSSTGFAGTEIVNRVVEFIGNTKTTFQTYVEQTLPLAEFRFCKIHDWSFLHKQNLSLTVTSGTNVYTLNTASIGFEMTAKDVETIFDPAQGRVLAKKTLKELRRLDPEVDDGSSSADIQYWAPVNDNQIMVWPKTFRTTTLKVDGKISPTPLLTLSNYPTIPFRYQEGFIEYIIAIALQHENDDRFESQKNYAISLIQQDMQDDLTSGGNTEAPRMRSMNEAAVDGVGGSDNAWIASLFS